MAAVCDCHMHIFDDRFPMSPTATLRPPAATVSTYKKFQTTLGLGRSVVVQPSSYGVDNSCLLDALQQFGTAARGVAVVNDKVSDAELDQLASGGVRGIRFNLVQAGATSIEMLQPLAERIAGRHWHVQVHCTPDTLAANGKLLAGLPVPVVLDHMARISQDQVGIHPAQRTLFELLDTGKTWVKLSAPYLNGWEPGAAPGKLGTLVQELLREAPARLVWASDWPHVTETQWPDDRQLLEQFKTWVNDSSAMEKILVENPEQLYGFAD